MLPNVLAVPLLQAAEVLGCQPIVSYYSTVLANWRYETNDRYNFTHSCENNCSYSCDPFDSTTWINSGVSSTVDEKWFYFASLLVEQHSCAIVPLIKEIYRIIHYSESEQVLETDNNATLEHFLRQLQGHLRRMIDSFKKVRESCLPAVFYNSLRKYLSGPRGYPAHFPNEQIQFGDRCVELDNHQIFEPVKKSLFGASAGQSPLIHALDALFGILHDQPPGTQPRQTDRDLSQSDEVPYLLQMRSYMISSHRNFLTWIESWPISLRLYIQTTATEPFDALTVDSTGTLKLVFNDCIKELDRFRKIHYGVVVEYIINQAHIEDGVLSKGNENAEKADSNVKGTGGTDLVSFLTKVRAAVPRALLDLQ